MFWLYRMSGPLSVLSVLGAQLGNVEGWSSDELIEMFVEEPRARVIKGAAAFMYGNCVRVTP